MESVNLIERSLFEALVVKKVLFSDVNVSWENVLRKSFFLANQNRVIKLRIELRLIYTKTSGKVRVT